MKREDALEVRTMAVDLEGRGFRTEYESERMNGS